MFEDNSPSNPCRVIGVDFDNTIVCYDRLFYQSAVELDLISPEVTATKQQVRNHLCRAGRGNDWTELQGYVYGYRIREAELFPGVDDFFRCCVECGISTCIISHKTRHPVAGHHYDLHESAMSWLDAVGFLDVGNVGLSPAQVFFEPTKERKLGRIADMRCDYFVDDLPELLLDPEFPGRVKRILFDPARHHSEFNGLEIADSWKSIKTVIFKPAPFSN